MMKKQNKTVCSDDVKVVVVVSVVSVVAFVGDACLLYTSDAADE